MSKHDHDRPQSFHAHCCPCSSHDEDPVGDVSRRGFLGSAVAFGGVTMSGLSWSALTAAEPGVPQAPERRTLVVKPVFAYTTYTRRPQTSWRSWGGVETQEQAEEEMVRIQGELKKLQAAADFPVKMLPLSSVRGPEEVKAIKDIDGADVLLVYACDGRGALDALSDLGKDVIFFCRHKSGPVYLWYEIMSPRYLRQHSDELKRENVDEDDVVVDSLDQILWRLRALCGLRNTMGAKIVAVGGPGGWCTPDAPELAKNRFNLDIQTVEYPQLAELIKAARADKAAMERSRRRADQYLSLPGTTLETKREFIDNAFVLEEVFRKLMQKAGCRMMTIRSCMSTVMPMSETTACLPLSMLNDDGYLAFCESDFVVIPSGILLAGISGRPVFLNDPTYPHDGIITLAHCTGPRKMDGKKMEPARILTHFESDYGAAPKVDMAKGQKLTNIAPDFKAERWVGVTGDIVDAPFLPICRDQIDVGFPCDSLELAKRMPGFHWMTCYGDYTRELGYALKKIPIQWDFLG